MNIRLLIYPGLWCVACSIAASLILQSDALSYGLRFLGYVLAFSAGWSARDGLLLIWPESAHLLQTQK